MLENKRIIMIHGLASKPPQNDLHKLWTKCLVENLKAEDKNLLSNVKPKQLNDIFRTVYWANEVPTHLEDDPDHVKSLQKKVNTVIAERKKQDDFHVGLGSKFKAFFKNRGLDVVDIFSTALTIKDNVAAGVLEEVNLYKNDQYIADRIRTTLEEELKDAWDNNKDVALLSHSMGTFVSYDVLWRFARRNVSDYPSYQNKKVNLFVTLGSPLGDKVVQDLLFGSRYGTDDQRFYPSNIDYWHNYACLGDIVSHDSTLDDDFFQAMIGHKLLKKNKVRDYKDLYNPFIAPSGKRNPHKSYGYLVQPKLAKWLVKFLKNDL